MPAQPPASIPQSWVEKTTDLLVKSCPKDAIRYAGYGGRGSFVQYGRFKDTALRVRFYMDAVKQEIIVEATSQKVHFSKPCLLRILPAAQQTTQFILQAVTDAKLECAKQEVQLKQKKLNHGPAPGSFSASLGKPSLPGGGRRIR